MIRALLFDLWETLGTKNVGISKSLQSRFGIPKSDDFLHHYEQAVQLKKWDSEEEMATNFLNEFQLPVSGESIQYIIELFRSGVEKATLFPGAEELLLSLKDKSYKLGLLSNTTVFESSVVQKLNLDRFFDSYTFSWQTGHLKPSQESFDAGLAKMNSKKEETVFVDDSQKNIIAAESFGIRGIRFESVEQLIQELHKLEII